MSDFRIFETETFRKDLKHLFKGRGQFLEKLADSVYPQLKLNPYFGRNIKKIKSLSPETWRYRIGDYRFFFSIDDQERIIFMLTAVKREKCY
ncbi:MAG: type II toxin-antitoxin system RelE/ParE family toxin [Candidatus Wallbacteria bacterium]|nr:type II toxin-antitoxin system RelE/ParE family toxin [Candidatus Wallbacteria bacterium]